jgi:hypothetical protein
MRSPTYHFVADENCPECEGEGFIVTGMKAGFNTRTMEVTAEDDGHHCPLCEEKSQADYEYASEQAMDEWKDRMREDD